jgi:SAM-dependent methyltransferase
LRSDKINQQTATRATLSDKWVHEKKSIDWMSVPGMADYVNSLVSGRPIRDGGHWADYVRDIHLIPLREKLGRDLTVLSLGCGQAHIDAAMVKNFGWPIKSLTGLEFDEKLREQAQRNFQDLAIETQFHFFDFNNPGKPSAKYDVVFSHHALHHAYELELILTFIEEAMHGDSLFVGSEYLGPTQFQITPEARKLIDHLFEILPDELKVDCRQQNSPPAKQIHYPSAKEVAKFDPSESVRSSDLRSLLFARFTTIDRKPMGGTLLRWLFQYRAGNFDYKSSKDRCIASLLQTIEKHSIENKLIHSDDLLFILKAQ